MYSIGLPQKMIFHFIAIAAILLSGCTTSADETEENKNTDLAVVDEAITDFMTQYNVPGLSLAVVKNEKLVYAKGYGKADTENGEDVNKNSLFRIASVSKPITGIAIMKLAETGMLSLDDTVFGEDGLLGTRYGSKSYSPVLKQITVRHLLWHTSGNWPNDGTDPMFRQQQLDVHELLDWVLDTYPHTVTPGTRYAYSNFGYAVLGRVIEQVTGLSYEDYVKNEILKPAGITNMQMAGNTEAERKSGEVKYYPQGSNEAALVYNMNVERMDAHGGWIASATDLARLLVRVDGANGKPDILSANTIQEMVTPSAQNPNYAKGWGVNSAGNWWHNGSLPGTGSIMVKASNGMSWVILTNTRSQDLNRYNTELDMLMWNILDVYNPSQWPDRDLF